MVRVLIISFRNTLSKNYARISISIDVLSVKVIRYYNVRKQRNFVYRIFFYSYIFIKNNRNFLITIKIKNVHTSSSSQ